MSKLLVIGESCLDVFHYGNSTRLCPEAPAPVFNSKHIVKNGGMAMNTYNNIVSFGFDADIITNANWREITKTRFVDKRTNHMFMRLDENDDQFEKCKISNVDFSLYDMVVVSDYNKGFLLPSDLQKISTLSKCCIIDTKKVFGDWIHGYDFIKVNNLEYNTTKHTISKIIKNKLIITQGPKGCTHKGVNYPVPLVEIKDTSGAGDTFVAAFSVKFCETRSVKDSITFANSCATKVVQKIGVATV